jgi:hypothetical protein
MSNFFSESGKIRENNLDLGIEGLKSRIKDVDYEVSRPIKEEIVAERKYNEIQVADAMYQMYKDRVAPTIKEDEPLVVANTHAMKVNAKALMKSLAGYRNGGGTGPLTHFTHQCNGDVGSNNPNYNALVVAGTEMTLEETQPETIEDYRERIDGVMEACWKGYKRKPGTIEGTKGSCVKEEAEELLFDETITEERYKKQRPINAYPASLRAKTMGMSSADRDKHFANYDAGNPRIKTVESVVVDELKDKLMEMDDHSWQSIDKVMRSLAKEHKITPKQLHKDFKAENDGQIPDEWIKENKIMEEAGWMPLEEAVAINEIGNVYEVTGMWHAHTRRIKFFVPTVGIPTRDEIQYYFEMFFPGGKVISHYPSMHPGDNIKNEMVVVVPMKEEWVELEQRSWVQMTDAESAMYEMICEEEGEPTSPPMITEDGKIELWVEDHDTGEERQVIFEGKKDACYNKVKSRYKVWPSAYASGALVKCREKGASKWGNSSKKEEYIPEDMSGMSQKSGDKRSTESGAGMTAQGVAKYNRRTGGNLKTAVTTPPSKLKPGSKSANRRKSFCARSRGWTGERGKAARSRWNC